MVNTFPPYNFSFKLFDLITIAIPPVLPVALTFGKLVITINLNMRNILCQKTSDLIECGVIDCVCFDKTGTLTSSEMKINCLIPVDENFFLEKIKIMPSNLIEL